MKSKFLVSSVLAGTALMALAATDPVLMTINGKDVKLSEFEYLYHKNNQQQVEKESLEQYVDRFIIYKQKVADAEAARIDTLPSFIKEFDGYKRDIVNQSHALEDTTVRDRLVNEAYERMGRNVDIDHFMYNLGRTPTEQRKNKAFVDSIRQCVLNGEDWETLVEKYSVDQSKARNKGHYGYITAGVFPYEFEYAAFNTPVGTVSEPIRTAYGFHLIRVNGERPDEGKVNVQHILKLFPRNATDSAKQATKAKIDSVYALVTAPGADFAEIAKAQSEDPGSAKRGGDLGWFGRGRMVPQFEKVAFDLPDGAISEPFETAYGYHIIKKIATRKSIPLEEVRGDIINAMSRDERSKMPQQAIIDRMKVKYNYAENNGLDKYLTTQLERNGGYDSTFVADVLKKSTEPIFSFAGKTYVLKDISKRLNSKMRILDVQDAKDYIKRAIPDFANKEVLTHYTNNLIDDNVDYRNLLNEYRDGMLLFEISNRRVWEAASRDTTGLKEYFEANRGKYTWPSPHFKGIILSAKNDSVMQAVKADIATMAADTLTMGLHKKYGRDIKMERMNFPQGENELVDYLYFNGPKPTNENYPLAMTLEGGLINAPQEVADVRGQVTSDYQDVLEKRWLQELKTKYPAKVNKKVLKKVKP